MKNGKKNIKFYIIFFIGLVILSISKVNALTESETITQYPLPYTVGDKFQYNFSGHDILVEYTTNNIVEFTIDTVLLQYDLTNIANFNEFIWWLSGTSDNNNIYLITGYTYGNKPVYMYNYCYSNFCPLTINEKYFSTGGDFLGANKYINDGNYGTSANMIIMEFSNNHWNQLNSDNIGHEELVFGSNINFILWDGTTGNTNINDLSSAKYNFLQLTNLIHNPINFTKTPHYIDNWTYNNTVEITLDSEYLTSEYRTYCRYRDLSDNLVNINFNNEGIINLDIYKNQTVGCFIEELQTGTITSYQTQINDISEETRKTHMYSLNLTGQFLSSIDIEYNYYNNQIESYTRYIPFTLQLITDEENAWTGSENVIYQFLGQYIDSNGNYQNTSTIRLVGKKILKNRFNWQISGYIDTGGFSNFKISFKVLKDFANIEGYYINYLDNTPDNWSATKRNIIFQTEDFTGYNLYNLRGTNVMAYIYKTDDTNSPNTGNILFSNYDSERIFGQWYYGDKYVVHETQTKYNSNYKKYTITFDYSNDKKIFVIYAKEKSVDINVKLWIPDGWSIRILESTINENVPIANNQGTLGTITPDINNQIVDNSDLEIFSVVGNYLGGSDFLIFSGHITKIVSEGFSQLPNELQGFIIFSICLTLVLAIILSVKRW